MVDLRSEVFRSFESEFIYLFRGRAALGPLLFFFPEDDNLGVLMSIVCSVYVCDECAARYVYDAIVGLMPLIRPVFHLIRT